MLHLKRLGVFALFAILGFSSETSPMLLAQQEEGVGPMINEAQQLFVAGLQAEGTERLDLLRQSLKKLEDAVEIDDTLPPARTMWGKLLLSAGDQKSGRVALQQAVAESPDDPEAYVLLANIATLSGQLAEAQLTYEEAKRQQQEWPIDHPRKRNTQAQVEAGLAAIAEARIVMSTQNNRPDLVAKFEEIALQHLKQWTMIDAENSVAFERLGNALLRANEVDGTVAAFDRARELNPNLPATDLRLAKAYFARGESGESLKRLEQAVADSPQDIVARAVAADLLCSMGRLEDARQQIDAALVIDPENLSAQLLNAQWYRYQGEFELAAERLQELNTKNPTDFEVANLLALTLSEIDSDESRRRAVSLATVNAQRFADLNTPVGRRARVTLIWTAFSDGQTEPAKEALNQLLGFGIQSNQVSGDEAYYAARVLVDFGRPELAVALLGNMLKRPDRFPKRDAAELLKAQLE